MLVWTFRPRLAISRSKLRIATPSLFQGLRAVWWENQLRTAFVTWKKQSWTKATQTVLAKDKACMLSRAWVLSTCRLKAQLWSTQGNPATQPHQLKEREECSRGIIPATCLEECPTVPKDLAWALWQSTQPTETFSGPWAEGAKIKIKPILFKVVNWCELSLPIKALGNTKLIWGSVGKKERTHKTATVFPLWRSNFMDGKPTKLPTIFSFDQPNSN